MEDLLTRPTPTRDGTVTPPVVALGSRGDGPGVLGTSSLDAVRARHGKHLVDRLVAWRHFDALLLVTLAALALVLHGRTLWTSYWGDEAIAVGIAAHPVATLPHYLVEDGSPPLYYVALHYWMRIFGQSVVATHVLSLVPGLLAIPAAWWSAGRLFGRWAARAAAGFMATCAYLAYYSTETRMYSWLVLVALLAVTYFVLAFKGEGRRYWVAATALMAAALYLQYYALYLLAATVIVGSAVAAQQRSRSQLRATWLYGGASAVLFAPWVPQFLFQLRNTGAPWAPHPAVLDFFGDSFNALASAAWAAVVIALVVAVLSHRRQPPEEATSTVPGTAALSPNTSALALFTAVALVTLVIAWLVGQVVNSWSPRYLGIAVVPALVPLAGGLARAAGHGWRG